MTMAPPKHDPVLAAAIGERLRIAYRNRGYTNEQQFLTWATARTGIADRQLRKYLHAEAVPTVPLALKLADALEISLDWLLAGAEASSTAFRAWHAGPVGSTAPADAVRYLRTLPTHGMRNPDRFYDVALSAYMQGVRLAPAEQAQAVRDTLRNT